MRSSLILDYSHEILGNYQEFSGGEKIPTFIWELSAFAKCLYYIERHETESELIFRTKNYNRWKRCTEKIQDIIDILMISNSINKERITIKFEKDKQEEEEPFPDKFNSDYAINILLSGGADSMCGAYNYVNKLGKKVVFTHTYHRNTPSIEMLRKVAENDFQSKLFEIDGLFKDPADFRNISGTSRSTEWNLNQTRTFLYLCNAVAVNFALKIRKIYITENGPLTINPQFSEKFEFTNTTNPEFLDFFNQFLNLYFNRSDIIKVFLPFKDYTKAELMAAVPSELLEKTHSCSRLYCIQLSCFKCYACFLRRFSAYAYENYDDDNYNPLGKRKKRYRSLKQIILFQKPIEYFRSKIDDSFLIDLIAF